MEGRCLGQPGAGNSELHFTATFGLDFHIATGFFFRHVDAGVRVIFVLGGWGVLALPCKQVLKGGAV